MTRRRMQINGQFKAELQQAGFSDLDRWMNLVALVVDLMLEVDADITFDFQPSKTRLTLARTPGSAGAPATSHVFTTIIVGLSQPIEGIVFGLFHEYGHLLQPTRPQRISVEDQLAREVDAWKKAAVKVPEDFRPAFDEERERCLDSYRSLVATHSSREFESALTRNSLGDISRDPTTESG